jgi:hypothetical protein
LNDGATMNLGWASSANFWNMHNASSPVDWESEISAVRAIALRFIRRFFLDSQGFGDNRQLILREASKEVSDLSQP